MMVLMPCIKLYTVIATGSSVTGTQFYTVTGSSVTGTQFYTVTGSSVTGTQFYTVTGSSVTGTQFYSHSHRELSDGDPVLQS